MLKILPVIGFAILAAVILIILICWRKAACKKKQNQEQVDRIMKENALNRALSNASHQCGQTKPQAQEPLEVHYNSKISQAERGSILRLTEQAESVTKEYLFQRSDVIYIGEEYGRAAVFRERGTGKLYCELFPYQDNVYIRLCSSAQCRLLRGKQCAPLSSKGICLRSGDRIETQTGVFLVELI